MPITQKEYQVLDEAYQFFNKHLFNSELPDCLVVLSTKGGRKNYGIYWAGIIQSRLDKEVLTDEITLNVANFPGRTDKDILSTLVHEMAHLWQRHFSNHKHSKFGYHDKTWGKKMKEIGLYPSNTGAPGGKETGRQMNHYILVDGLFEKFCGEWLRNYPLNWQSLEFSFCGKEKKKSKNAKYTCPNCDQKFSGKPGLNVTCTDCEVPFESEVKDND